MSQSSEDLFYQFTEEYEKGNFLKALQLLIPYPDIAYDSLYSTLPLFRFLIHYADACVFKGALEVGITNQVLQTILASDPRLSILLDQFNTFLKQEETFIYHYYLDQIPEIEEEKKLENEFVQLKRKLPEDKSLENFILSLPHFYQSFMWQKFKIFKRWKEWSVLKPQLAQSIGGEENALKQPWQIFSYPIPMNPLILSEGEVPLIFLEPLEVADYTSFLTPYREKPVIFVIETISSFFQLLQFDDLFAFLLSPQAFVYILESYPQAQFEAQGLQWQKNQTFQPILMTRRRAIEEALPLLTSVLRQYLNQTEQDLKKETPLANWLYHIAKRLLFKIQAEKYGKSRCLALSAEESMRSWHDPHKGLPPPGVDLGHLPKDYKEEMIKQALVERQTRPFAPKQKIRLAHIVPQLVDGGHAPSRLLRTLLLNSDQNWFDLFVISTEYMANHPLEYPLTAYQSAPSQIRARETLSYFQTKGINTFIENSPVMYETIARHIVQFLKDSQIDIAVFHGPDEVNNLCASLTDVPIRVFFDHGTLPTYPCFDLLILSTEEAYKAHQAEFKQMGMESTTLFFSIDVREGWKEQPYTKEELGFPEESFIMTTISNHLTTRISLEMCHAIGEILRRSPKAFYAPIGPMEKPDKFRAIFAKYGVNERVIFLGSKECPSQYARSMDLYLNEFPFGSGLGILDAMAAGCPVVSMYDAAGPQQARYGATYFGVDHVITTGQTEDYVRLACRLINDKAMYCDWSDYAKTQYAKRVDIKKYARKFESILENFIIGRIKK